MNKLRVFVSSVQKELARERQSVSQLITVDPFLQKHAEAVLFEYEPTTGKPNRKGYLESLAACQIYLLILDVEYGRPAGTHSATHEEYLLAQKNRIPTAVFIRGLDDDRDQKRKRETQEFIKEIETDGHKYCRFHDREDLKPALRDAVYSILTKHFALTPSREEEEEANHQIETASPFESVAESAIPISSLKGQSLDEFVELVLPDPAQRIWDDSAAQALVRRGLTLAPPGDDPVLTRAAILLFFPRPSDRFPQCEILADAYDEPKVTGKPKGQETIRGPLLEMVETAIAFIDKHTFHPRRVVGLNNVRLDEYPVKALREVLINAMAHRNYEDATRKIILRVFSDRIEVASPGYPLKPLTLVKLRKGSYRPCSRNPLIAQTLSLLHQMEQRGTGFARMREAMLDHGLDAPALSQGDGYFVVTLPGTNGAYDKIRVPADVPGMITPAIESRLNDRQKEIAVHVQTSGSVTRSWCVERFGIANDTAGRDLKGLVKAGLLVIKGKARAAHYVWQSAESTENRPTKS